jgi:mRNA-degrading endonuclease RelE of RelBE toxin-antitoxin system
VYDIQIHEDAEKELEAIRLYDRNRILDDIEEQLSHEPKTVTKRKKILEALELPWDQLGPVWQLRVEDFRVYYDVLETEGLVVVRAVRSKPSHRTTDDIL